MRTLSVHITNIVALITLTMIYLLPVSRNIADGPTLISVLIWLFLLGTVISFFTALVSAWKNENPQESESEEEE